jgi:flagellar basal-body rod protein FlgG
MIRAIYNGASGMIAQQFFVDVTANNLANVNTTGFKRSEVSFQDLFFSTLRAPGLQLAAGQQAPIGIQVGNGVQIVGTTPIFTQGPLTNTGNPLDVAINGIGFFQVTAADGTTRYTRDGALRLNSQGNLVTAEGLLLEPQITIPNDAISITIAADGTVSVVTQASPTPQTVGNIQLASFPNPGGLLQEGDNLFRETAASGTPTPGTPGQDGLGSLQQGFLEQSNVEAVQELVNLIVAQRAFEFNSRTVTVSSEMLQTAADLVR